MWGAGQLFTPAFTTTSKELRRWASRDDGQWDPLGSAGPIAVLPSVFSGILLSGRQRRQPAENRRLVEVIRHRVCDLDGAARVVPRGNVFQVNLAGVAEQLPCTNAQQSGKKQPCASGQWRQGFDLISIRIPGGRRYFGRPRERRDILRLWRRQNQAFRGRGHGGGGIVEMERCRCRLRRLTDIAARVGAQARDGNSAPKNDATNDHPNPRKEMLFPRMENKGMHPI